MLLQGLHSVKSRCFFILQLGYFKHSYQFFTFGPDEVQDDVRYLQARYFPDESPIDVDVTKVTRLKQQRLILGLFNLRTCDAEDRWTLSAKAKQAAKISTKPLYIFRELNQGSDLTFKDWNIPFWALGQKPQLRNPQTCWHFFTQTLQAPVTISVEGSLQESCGFPIQCSEPSPSQEG